MKPKALWLVAGTLLLALCLMWWQHTLKHNFAVKIGLTSQQIEFMVPDNPVLFFSPGTKFGVTKNRFNLERPEAAESQRSSFFSSSYTNVQPGLFLLNLDGERVFVFASYFKPENLDPSVAIDFKSDWVVLQKSSLLPEAWPVPNQGWIVLNRGTLSKRIKQLSADEQKPVIRPVSNGTLWLEKELAGNWVVKVPE